MLPPPDLDPASLSYSTADVARRLGVSTPTVQRWVDLGHLKAWRTVGGHRRIDASSVEAFIRGRDPEERGPLPADLPGAVPTVLVVDDNPDDRDLLVAVVEEALPGAHVSVAANGFEGLLSIGQATPDVLITDVVMPHMDGLEMLRHLAASPARRPHLVIATSSRTRAQLAALGPWPDAVQYAPKPIEAEAVIGLLRSAALGNRPA